MFTGWTVDGGYAEYAVAPAAFTYRLPDNFNDMQAAPLLCAGIIGYRCLRLAGLSPIDTVV
jgi:propanol-preferring alcohol dehydrogenase